MALKFFRLQQMQEGSIDLSDGELNPRKGPTDVGTAQVKDEEVTLSSLVDRLNERFGTDFAEADRLFFDQMRASAENNESIAEAARANNRPDFAHTWSACSTSCSLPEWRATRKYSPG